MNKKKLAIWTKHKLNELGFVGRGRSRHRPRNEPTLYSGSYPFFQTGDIKGADLYLYKYTQTYSNKGLAQSKLWKPGTLCITIAANIAETAILKVEGCFPDSVVGFIPDNTKVDVRFIKYYIDTIKNKMQNVSRGTTQDNLSLEKILTFDFLTPPIPTQQKIAAILSAYDDLIENNTRRIKLLEEMAQAIYREWFVYFRFSGHESVQMVESELGPVPEGWKIVKVTDAVNINPRITLPKEGIKPFLSMGCLTENTMNVQSIEYREGNSGSKFQNSDTLFARITPCLENGKTVFIQFLPTDSDVGFGSTEFIVLRSKTLTPEFVYLLSRTDSFRDNAIKSMSGATGRQRVQEECFEKYFIVHPDTNTLDAFEEIIKPIFKSVYNVALKDEILRRTRDLLLPKLIGGEIDVSGLDIRIPEAEA